MYEHKINNLIEIIKRNIGENPYGEFYNYADVKGIGYWLGIDPHIDIFQKHDSDYLSAVNIDDSNFYFSEISNQILQYIEFPVFIGDSLDKIQKLFGKPYNIDHLLVYPRFQYSINKNYWFSIGIENDKAVNIEIIFDSEIIQNIREVRDN